MSFFILFCIQFFMCAIFLVLGFAEKLEFQIKSFTVDVQEDNRSINQCCPVTLPKLEMTTHCVFESDTPDTVASG